MTLLWCHSLTQDNGGILAKKVQSIAMETFNEAAQIWLRGIKLQVAPRTYHDYVSYVRTLSNFFGEMKLQDIEIEHLEEYQQARSSMVFRGKLVGPVSINHEIGLVLRQLLKRIGRWDSELGPRYKPVRMPKEYESPGKALKPNEEEKIGQIFHDAVERFPNHAVAALASLLSLATTLGPGEIRSLQLKDVQLELNPPRIQVPLRGAKRKRRARTVVLVGEGLWAAEHLMRRALEKCACRAPDHFLIPFRTKRNSYDPTKPTQGWRYSLRELLAAAEIKMRNYDFRHHAVTKLLENPNVSEQTAKDIAGWISPKMFNTYSHARIEALQGGAYALDRKVKRALIELAPVEKISNAQKRRAI